MLRPKALPFLSHKVPAGREGGQRAVNSTFLSILSHLKKKKIIITMFGIQFYFEILFGIPAFIAVTY